LGGREGALILLASGSASSGGLGIRVLGFGAVRGEVPCDEGGGVGVLPISERISLPRIRELVRVSTVAAVQGSGAGVISGYLRVERG